jgi:Protein of unknown function DUF262
MSLSDEVRSARKNVITDGYEMSIGEIINLYRDDELVIDPAFQRLFRWDDERKSRFIESLLLGIPIPPIFVYQIESGVWELVDGLQRVSTILQFTGDLKGEMAQKHGVLVLSGTKMLPSLDGKRWKPSSPKADDGLEQGLQIDLKRARIRVEILKSDSDRSAKFELFQRLNTGGVELTEQEVRNSIAISLNRKFYDWIMKCSGRETFVRTTCQTEAALHSQAGVELALRFFAFNNVPYRNNLDVHEYLDDALLIMASSKKFDYAKNTHIFEATFDFLDKALDANSFKKWNGSGFSGKFLMSVFEVLSTGVAQNIAEIETMSVRARNDFLKKSAQALWKNKEFTKNSGAGVRGSTRLAHLLPLAKNLLKP